MEFFNGVGINYPILDYFPFHIVYEMESNPAMFETTNQINYSYKPL